MIERHVFREVPTADEAKAWRDWFWHHTIRPIDRVLIRMQSGRWTQPHFYGWVERDEGARQVSYVRLDERPCAVRVQYEWDDERWDGMAEECNAADPVAPGTVEEILCRDVAFPGVRVVTVQLESPPSPFPVLDVSRDAR